MQEAKEAKARRELEARTGGAVDDRRVLFAEFARDWVTSYQGKGRSGFRENTRAEYRRDLERYAIAFLGPRQRVAEITPRHMARFVAWLCDDAAQRRRHAEETARRVRDGERPAPSPRLPLSDQTVRRIVAPLRACLGGAVREGLIASNPCASLALPHRPRIDDDDEAEVKALTRAQLHAFLAIVNPRYRTVFEVLATTGLRISELLPLQWRHLHLDGDRPSLRVRRASVRGVLGPPKSKYGRRELPLPLELAADLRARRLATPPASRISCSPAARARCSTGPTCVATRSRLRRPRSAPGGWASIPCGTRARRCSSTRAATPSRCNDGSGTTRPPLHWPRTSTCSATISARRSRSQVAPHPPNQPPQGAAFWQHEPRTQGERPPRREPQTAS